MSARSVLVTGARGAIGRQLVRALARPGGVGDGIGIGFGFAYGSGAVAGAGAPGAATAGEGSAAEGSAAEGAGGAPWRPVDRVIAVDIRAPDADEHLPGVEHVTLDVRSPALAEVIARHGIDTVVHLAAIVTPAPGMTRQTMHDIDVGGTRNVLDACVRGGVRQLVVTSSGAAYGYHADNPPLLEEHHPLRGNPEFAYSDHKRIVEEMLAKARAEHPELGQLVLRLCTVLGESIDNQITAMFFRPAVIGVEGAPSPFVFVWDEDVVEAILAGVYAGRTGVYNLAGDGALTLREMAAMVGRPYLAVPAPLLASVIARLARRGATGYGPEQVIFLQHRPVLGNARIKRDLGLRPLSSRDTFLRYIAAVDRRRSREPADNKDAGRWAGITRALSNRLGRDDRLARTTLGALGWTIDRLGPTITKILERG